MDYIHSDYLYPKATFLGLCHMEDTMHSKAARGVATAISGRPTDLADATILWTECLHGTLPVRDALASVSAATAAASAMIYRWCTKTRRARIIAAFHRDAPRGVQPMPQPFGPDLIPVELNRARPGSVWRLEDAADSLRLDGRQARAIADRGLVDIVAIPLGQSDGQVDVLELCLDRTAGRPLVVALADFARVLSFAWGRRPRGRIARLLANAPGVSNRVRATAPQAALSVGNPWRLTPTEMRICHLIREGHEPANLTALIGVAESTVRTHLRSIYAKSGVTGQVGLLRLLLSEPSARQA